MFYNKKQTAANNEFLKIARATWNKAIYAECLSIVNIEGELAAFDYLCKFVDDTDALFVRCFPNTQPVKVVDAPPVESGWTPRENDDQPAVSEPKIGESAAKGESIMSKKLGKHETSIMVSESDSGLIRIMDDKSALLTAAAKLVKRSFIRMATVEDRKRCQNGMVGTPFYAYYVYTEAGIEWKKSQATVKPANREPEVIESATAPVGMTQKENPFSKSSGFGKARVTSLRQQYLDIKAQYEDAIVLFQLGDFYEAFDQDAEIVARELDLVLTKRPISRDERVPMAGFPFHAVEKYIQALVAKDYHVAVCNQVGELLNGLVERKVTRVVKPEQKTTSVAPAIVESTVTISRQEYEDLRMVGEVALKGLINILDVEHRMLSPGDEWKCIYEIVDQVKEALKGKVV